MINLKTTEDCKKLLQEKYPALPKKGWKRTAKRLDNFWYHRTFENGDFVVEVTTREADGSGYCITEYPHISKPNAEIISRLKKAASAIKHCGDYGHMFFNVLTQEVWWTGGDGDFCEEAGHTSWDDALAILKVEGVTNVTLEGECDPCDEDEMKEQGWVALGSFGKEVNLDM